MPDPIIIHGALPQDCTEDDTYMRMLDGGCVNTDLKGIEMLTPEVTSPFYGMFPVIAQKQPVIAYEDENHVTICARPQFAPDVGYFIKRKIKVATLCPFVNQLTNELCGTYKYKIIAQYGEAVGPTAGVLSDFTQQDGFFTKDNTKNYHNLSTLPFTVPWEPSPFPFGSSHTASVNAFVELIQDDRNISEIPLDEINYCTGTAIRLTCTIDTMGLPFTVLSGQPFTQVKQVGCSDFAAGITYAVNGLNGFWLAAVYPIGPVGLVMAMNIWVKPYLVSSGDATPWSDCEEP